MRRFSVLVRELTLSKFVFVADLNSEGGGGNTNSNDSTVYFIIYEIHQLIHSTSVLLFMLNLTNYNLVYNALTLDGNNDLYEECVLPIRRFKQTVTIDTLRIPI